MSLAKLKLGLVMMDKFVAIWSFNEFNNNENSVLFMFREFEKGQKKTPQVIFCKLVSQVWKSVK